MTKEITKVKIIQELQDKFKLREFEPEVFSFSERVVPTYDIGQHVKHPKIGYKQVSCTSASGFLFFTVPVDEKWYLQRYTVVFTGAGAIKISGVYIARTAASGSLLVYLDLALNQIVSYAHDLPKPVELVSGDTISILVDDYTSTQDLRLYIDYTKEEIR